MKKYILFFLLIALLFISISCEDNSSNSTNIEQINADLTQLLQTNWDSYTNQFPNLPGGISVVVLYGNNNYFATYKMGTDMNPNKRFRVASITKLFTATAIMLLEQQGKLKIDDIIVSKIPGKNETYLPESPNYDIPYKELITIKQILEHRAGIYDLNNSDVPQGLNVPYSGINYINYMLQQDPNHNFTCDELAEVISKNQLSYFKPNTDYHYSDGGYLILSKIIERVSGESFGDFVSNNILKLNNLNNSLLPYLGSDQTIPEPFVMGNDYYEGEFTPVEAINISFQLGNGNLISTLNDLAKFGKALFTGNSGLKYEFVKKMMNTIPATSQTGYGLGCQEVYDLGYGHSGAIRGYISALYYDPNKEITIAIISNVINWSDLASEVILHREIGKKIKALFE